MVTMTTTTNLALRCGCVVPQSETITAVEGTDAHGDLITETRGNCSEHGWQRVDWTKDATYLDGDNHLLEVGNTVRIPWPDGNDPEADVAALFMHNGKPWATVTSSDKRLCTSAERGINCAGELEIECERIYRVG